MLTNVTAPHIKGTAVPAGCPTTDGSLSSLVPITVLGGLQITRRIGGEGGIAPMALTRCRSETADPPLLVHTGFHIPVRRMVKGVATPPTPLSIQEAGPLVLVPRTACP